MTRRDMARLGSAIAAGAMLCGMAPGDMSIAAFLARAEPVMRLGPLGFVTPEAERLKGEVVAAGRRFKARIEAERRAGLKSDVCPPENGTLTPEQWLAHLQSYPARMRRHISVNAAFDGLMKKRYPCPD